MVTRLYMTCHSETDLGICNFKIKSAKLMSYNRSIKIASGRTGHAIFVVLLSYPKFLKRSVLTL